MPVFEQYLSNQFRPNYFSQTVRELSWTPGQVHISQPRQQPVSVFHEYSCLSQAVCIQFLKEIGVQTGSLHI